MQRIQGLGEVLLALLGKPPLASPCIKVTITNIDKQVDKIQNNNSSSFTQSTDSVIGGGPTCDFASGNRLEFTVSVSNVSDISTIKFEAQNTNTPSGALLPISIGECEHPLRTYLTPDAGKAIRFQLYQKKLSPSHQPANVGRVIASVHFRPNQTGGGGDGGGGDSGREGEDGVLVVEVWRVVNLACESESVKAAKERFGVLVAVLMVALYLGVGVLFYTGFHGKWKVRQSLYFAVATFTTVGYGDLNASKLGSGAQIFTAFYALVGVTLVGSCIGLILAYIIEKREKSLMQKMMTETYLLEDASKQKRDAIFHYISVFLRIFVIIIVGMLLHYYLEESGDNKSWVNAFYFATITVTTIGFGDFSFLSLAGQWCGIFYIPIATAITASAINSIVGGFLEFVEHRSSLKILGRALTPELLDEMDEDRSGGVDESEFIRKMLVRMGKVSDADVRAIKRKFRELDVSGDGVLTIQDIKMMFEDPGEIEVAHRVSKPPVREN